MPNFNHLLTDLQRLNLDIRRQLETAEAAIPLLNKSIEQLTRVGLLPAGLVTTGDVVLERPYTSDAGCDDSAQIIQAMLVTPHGVGAVYWDVSEYVARQNVPDNPADARQAITKFVPFSKCDSAVKALLVHHAAGLVETVRRSVSISS